VRLVQVHSAFCTQGKRTYAVAPVFHVATPRMMGRKLLTIHHPWGWITNRFGDCGKKEGGGRREHTVPFTHVGGRIRRTPPEGFADLQKETTGAPGSFLPSGVWIGHGLRPTCFF
jgi:hypothetical protein